MSLPLARARLPRQLFSPFSTTPRRGLHMTGPAEYSSAVLAPSPSHRRRHAPPSTTTSSDRNFNTSRALKAPKDTSPLDLAFLPDLSSASSLTEPRIPMLDRAIARDAENQIEPPVLRPEILAADPSSVVAPLADVHDNTSVPIDFGSVAEGLGRAAERMGVSSLAGMEGKEVEAHMAEMAEEAEKGKGAVGRLWAGLMDDVFGPKGVKKVA